MTNHLKEKRQHKKAIKNPVARLTAPGTARAWNAALKALSKYGLNLSLNWLNQVHRIPWIWNQYPGYGEVSMARAVARASILLNHFFKTDQWTFDLNLTGRGF